MPTWKKKDPEGKLHFQFLCQECNSRKTAFLKGDNWTFVRDGDPASCNDCAIRCALTTRELWGAEDQVRYRICERCENYRSCDLKGRHYC